MSIKYATQSTCEVFTLMCFCVGQVYSIVLKHGGEADYEAMLEVSLLLIQYILLIIVCLSLLTGCRQ